MQKDAGDVCQACMQYVMPPGERPDRSIHEEERYLRKTVVGSKNGLPDAAVMHHDRRIGYLADSVWRLDDVRKVVKGILYSELAIPVDSRFRNRAVAEHVQHLGHDCIEI